MALLNDTGVESLKRVMLYIGGNYDDCWI